MDMDRKRNRRPVVCNVCRKRKVKCDRAKPACSACKKSNCVHLCIYEERESKRGRLPMTVSPPTRNRDGSSFNIRQKNTVSTYVPKDKQQRLQKENQHFKQQFQLQQNYQHSLQSQMAAKYGVTGANQSPPQQLQNNLQPLPPHPGAPGYNAPQLGYMNAPHLQQMSHPPPPPPGSFMPWGAQQGLVPIGQPYFQQPHLENGQLPFPPGAPGPGAFIPPFVQNPMMTPQQQNLNLNQNLNQNINQNQQFQQQQQQQLQQQNILAVGPGKSKDQGKIDDDDDDEEEEEENIDPSLYSSDEITNIFQEYTKYSKFIDIGNDGLFGNVTLTKKDPALTLFYLNLVKYQESLDTSNHKTSDKFSKLLENRTASKVESYYKHETVNLNDILKKVAKILPNKKVIWSMIEKFFSGFSVPFLPVLNEEDFIKDITEIIGEKELVDSKPKMTIDLDDNENLVNLFFLIVIIRISQLSQTLTFNTEKQVKVQYSNEYDLLIELLFSIIRNIEISKFSKLKVLLFKELLSLISLEEDGESLNSSLVAFELNLNNKNQVRSDSTLNQTWFFTYFSYYYTHLKKGFPLLYGQELYNLDFIFKPMGSNYRKALADDYTLQVKNQEIFSKLFSRIYDYSNNDGIPIKNLNRWINELNNSKEISFNVFKNQIYPNYSKKIVKTIILIFAKFVSLNVYQYLLIHYENSLSKSKFEQTLDDAINSIQESVDVTFDILKNYSTYFHAGNEFILLPQILMIIDKVLSFLQALYIRSYLSGKPSLSILKTIIFIIEELEGFPTLKHYFKFWKLTYRAKLFLHLFKKEQLLNQGTFLNPKLELTNNKGKEQKIEFDEIKSNFRNFTDDEFNQFESKLDTINEQFDDSKYFKLRTVESFLLKLDCEEPEFNIELFQ